jgi:hypothetical protein
MMTPDGRGEQQQSTCDGSIKVVGGWRVSIKDHMTTMVGKDKQQECVAVDEGSNKEGESSKGDGDGDEGGGQQRGQGRQGQWHR